MHVTPAAEADANFEGTPQRNLAAPHRFFWAVLPYAIYIGFTTNGAASYLLRQAGLPMEQVANAVALLGIPSSIYFLWSPLADLWMPRRAWHVISTSCAAAALALGSLALNHNASAAVWLYAAGMIFCMLISSAYGGMISSMIAPESRTRTAAWAQASNMGGGALGPGLILFLALRCRPAVWTSVAAFLMVLPCLAVVSLREPARLAAPSFAAHLRDVGRELRETCVSSKNFFALILLLAPPGAGALIGLLPAIAQDYHVGGATVVWINGIGGGLLMGLGCLAGGWTPAGLDRRISYGLAGALNAAPAFFLAWAPPTPGVYMAGAAIYLFTIGLTSTVCMALVLDVVGGVGHSGSLRYSILMACSYLPIAYMSWIEGVASRHWGFRGFPIMEGLSSLFDLPLILVWLLWRPRGFVRDS